MGVIDELNKLHEDPNEQLFFESMQLQMTLAKDKETPIEQKIKALDELQRAYLAYKMTIVSEETGKNLGKAINQAKRLKGDD